MWQICASCMENKKMLDQILRVDKSFDLVVKPIRIGGREAVLYLVDGFAKDEVFTWILARLMETSEKDLSAVQNPADFLAACVPYVETVTESKLSNIVTSILSGTLCLLIEGFATAFLIDARTYPARGITEPEDSRVLRGSRDGFVETLIFNTALIRRRMRDPGLTMELVQIGKKSKTDVVLCYLAPLADPKTLQEIRTRVAKIDVNTLTLSQESLAECIAKTQWYNPFPNIRYTERPDVASANIAEGKIIVLVDNSPAVMIIPTTFFDFVQDINDFYFPPLIGTYLRLVRTVVFFITLFLTPVWLLLMQNPDWLPQSLIFLRIEDAYHVPLLVQLLIFEFVIDGLKLASLNTPSALSNSFSVVGALILGEFAVRSGWFVPDTVLYMAFVAIANFAQPSFELGYAFKLSRIVLLCGTAAFQAWGLLGATILIFVVLGTTRTVSGKSYLYPLIPWNGRALKNLLIRRRISRENTTT